MLTEDGGVQLTELFGLDTESIHLVRRPAIGRRFLLTKKSPGNDREGTMLTVEKDIEAIVAKMAGTKDETEMVALRKSAGVLFGELSEAVKGGKIPEAIAKALVEKGEALFKDKESVTKAEAVAWIGQIQEALKAAPPKPDAETLKPDAEADAQTAVIKAALDSLEKLGTQISPEILAALRGEVQKHTKTPEIPEDIKKSLGALPEGLRSSIVGLMQERATAIAKAAAQREADLLTRIEKSEQSQKALATALETIQVEKRRAALVTELNLKHIGGDAGQIADVVLGVEKSNPEQAQKLIAILKSAEEAAGKGGLFDENGTSRVLAGGSAEGKIEQIAKSMMGATAGLTIEAARAQAWKDHPELMREAREG